MQLSPLFRNPGKLPGRVIERLAAALFFVVSLIIPRSRSIWAFGSWYGSRFADNPKYLFLHCSTAAGSTLFPVWISRDKNVIRRIRELGLRAHHRLSPIGLWYSLRAGVYLVDCRVMDISSIASSGAIIVNLWHGVPLKKIEGDIEQADHPCVQARRGSLAVRIVNRLLRPQLTEKYDYILATSSVTAARFQSAFEVGPNQIITAGYPRTDPLFASPDADRYLLPEERELIADMRRHRSQGRRVLLYMPTFRDWHNAVTRTIPIDWMALDGVLASAGGVLYCKLHPSDRGRIPSLDGLASIRLIPTGIDMYPVLKYTDALITDYSSIFFDYLLLNRPLIFYAYDLDEYQQLSRTLYDPYHDVTPGPKARTAAELQKLVSDLLAGYPEMSRRWQEDRARVRKLAHEFADDRSSERLVAELLDKSPA